MNKKIEESGTPITMRYSSTSFFICFAFSAASTSERIQGASTISGNKSICNDHNKSAYKEYLD